MSKRSEEAALKAYPYSPTEVNLFGHKTITADGNSCDRAKYRSGYEQAEKEFGWHSVDECLPPVDEEVIVLTQVPAFGKISFAHLVNSDVMITIDGKPYKPEAYSGWNIPGVKFWMPMPEIPNEK